MASRSAICCLFRYRSWAQRIVFLKLMRNVIKRWLEIHLDFRSFSAAGHRYLQIQFQNRQCQVIYFLTQLYRQHSSPQRTMRSMDRCYQYHSRLSFRVSNRKYAVRLSCSYHHSILNDELGPVRILVLVCRHSKWTIVCPPAQTSHLS